MPRTPARRLPVMIALAVLVGVGFASNPAPATAADGPVAVPVSPVDGGLFTAGDLEFLWSAPREAVAYELRAGLDGRVDDAGALVDAPSTSTVPTVMPALAVDALPEGTYYWQVRAEDASGEAGPWSAVRAITIDLPGDGGGLQLDTLALGDYAVEGAPQSPTVAASDTGAVGTIAILIASGFSVVLLTVVMRRAAAVRVRT